MSRDVVGIAALTALLWAGLVLGASPADADPTGCPPAAAVDAGSCSARLVSVTADAVDGTITGTPAGGQVAITLSGQPQAYLPSTGFAGGSPDPVQQWDATLERVNSAAPPGNPTDPNWYGNGKATAFLPRQLNDLATRFPPETLVVRFTPDDGHPGWFRMTSIQPTG
ncbi:hypothetical protein CIW49_05100 [Mycolicibacterium sp. P1-18]|uniref:hypothetical protein n=1 Tax=Mycolicibacterium sp. P1-18 TaxID=2024615 RepID=UPI0011F1C876|nr:hypothetical protein [Mycolicibacterium sp. P1-18]KAA0101345.1 hypothetical protein CIW49_05100 [Mycolicibacterium sp. P1-18]